MISSIFRYFLFTVIVTFLIISANAHMKDNKREELNEKLSKIAMTPKEIKKVEQLHFGWYVQAVSALIGAMGKEMYSKMDRANKKAFVACMNKIEREHDLQMGANCLVKAFDGMLLSSYPDAVNSPQFDFVDKDYPPESYMQNSKRKEKKRKIKKYLKDMSEKRVHKILKESRIGSKTHKKTKTKDTALEKKPKNLSSTDNGMATERQKENSDKTSGKVKVHKLHRKSKASNHRLLTSKIRSQATITPTHTNAQTNIINNSKAMTPMLNSLNRTVYSNPALHAYRHPTTQEALRTHVPLTSHPMHYMFISSQPWKRSKHHRHSHDDHHHRSKSKYHEQHESNLRTPIRIDFNKFRHRRFKRNILSLYANEEMVAEAKRLDRGDTTHGFRVTKMDHMPSLLSNNKSPVKTVTNLISTVVGTLRNETVQETLKLKESYKKIRELQDMVEKKNNDGQFKHRMLDMVVGKNNPLRSRKTFTDRFRDIMPDVPSMADEKLYGLVDTVSKHTKDINYNMLSPRFLPIMPDKYSTSKKLLSPNLFPLYKDDSENSILPIPTILESTGMNEKDRDTIMELVMDLSGVNNAVDEAMKSVKGLKSLNLDKDVVDITNLLETTFKELENALHPHQKKHLEDRKYSFLEKEQMQQLYGENALLNRSNEFPFDMERYGEMSEFEKEESLRNTIRLIADGKMGDPHNMLSPNRSKRATVYFQHVTLSPYAFSPTVNTLSVLGPVTLSPSIFSPNILSPLLISPPVISPQVGNPLIFSPYVLGPNVLSAAVFNVYVFSPYVLAPNVINPYVLSPLILSPFVLCPDVLSPTILSGTILSPSVLSPSVFTDSALAANVLSPTFLS